MAREKKARKLDFNDDSDVRFSRSDQPIIPLYFSQDPGLWFTMLDGIFKVEGIEKDSTKFWKTCQYLPEEVSLAVREVIEKPPEECSYETLRVAVIKHKLNGEEIGKRGALQFLLDLQKLAGEKVPVAFLRTVWISRLPPFVQGLASVYRDDQLKTVAELIDFLIVLTEPQIRQEASTIMKLEKRFETMRDDIRLLKMDVDSLRNEYDYTDHSDSSSFNKSSHESSKSRNTQTACESRESIATGERVCWYHLKFGEAAMNCIRPCAFEKNTV